MDDISRIRDALACIPPDVDREQWARLAMAIKSELGGSGFEIWDGWSRSAASYNAKDARDTWKSIKPGGGVGIGTLFHVAKEHGWQPEGDYQPPTAEELEQRRLRQQAERDKAKAEERRRGAKAARKAAAIWNGAEPAPDDHGYLQAKGIQAHGLRLYRGDLTISGAPCDGALIVPALDTAGRVHSLQFITADGSKLFLPGGKLLGHFDLLGSMDDPAGRLAIAEGFATAASIHQATGWPVAVAFNAGNLSPVALALRKQYPQARLILCADDDHATPGNPGLTKAREAATAVGAALFVPDFSGIEPRGTDCNDLAQAAGLDELARQLAAAADADQAPVSGTQSADTLPTEAGAKVLPFPAAGGAGGPRGSGGDRFAPCTAGPYSLERGMIYFMKGVHNGPTVPIPLANFAALIVEEIHRDDGLEDEAAFIVEGRLNGGHALPKVEIPARGFAGMAWVPAHWGATAIVYAGQSTKDHLRAAVQLLSGDIPRRNVYAHCGWRKIGGAWQYLHGGGAITAQGQQSGVEVDMGKGHMANYRFPAPLKSGKPQVAAVRRLLALLDIAPGNRPVGAALLAAVCRAPLGEAYRIDHGLFLAGTTGAQKSECAALALACFGQFDARSFPANWSDSESDLEAKAHAAKDAVFVVDDFKPVGSQTDVQRLHSKADRLFRGVGNQAGRGRRGPDMKGRAAYHARGLVLATGEDVPKGVSLRARLLIVELARGDVDLSRLTALQQAAAAGELAAAMAGFLQWLAPQMDDLKSSLPERIRKGRDKAIAEGWATSHPRAAEMFASLYVGAGLFVSRYAVSSGALSAAEASTLLNRFAVALREALERQGDFIRDADEVERFLALLRAALSSGRAHLADSLKQGPPEIRPHGWGWRGAPDAPDDKSMMRAMGDCIGWLNAKTAHVWLDPEAAFATVQSLAREQGDTFTTSPRALWKMLHERGLLAEVEKDGGKVRFTLKKVVGGTRPRVLVLPSDKIEGL